MYKMRIPPYYRKPSWQRFFSGMAVGAMLSWALFLYFNGELIEKNAKVIHEQKVKIEDLEKDIKIWQDDYAELNKKNEEKLTVQEVKVKITNDKKYKLDALSIYEIEEQMKGDLNILLAKDLDSVFKSFFKCEDTLFQFHPFTFAPYRDFMDSLDLDFYLDSSLFLRPHGFRNFRYFPDTAWMDSFLPDSLFPDAYIPFFEVPKFHFPQDFFEKHHEWMERFFEGFTFPDDSLHRFHPKWQQLHRRQKKSAQGLEI